MVPIKQKSVRAVLCPNPSQLLSQSQSQSPFNDLRGPIQPGPLLRSLPDPSPVSLLLAALLRPFCFPWCFLNLLGSLLPQGLCTCRFFCLDSFPPTIDIGHSLLFCRSFCSNVIFSSRPSLTTFKKNCNPSHSSAFFFFIFLFTVLQWRLPPFIFHSNRSSVRARVLVCFI